MITKDKQVVKMVEIRSFERDILNFLCGELKEVLIKVNPFELINLEEIRIRAGKRLCFKIEGKLF